MDKKDNDNLRLVAKYTTAALQMAAIIVFGALAGQWLDEYFNTKPFLTIITLLVAIAAALYLFLKDITKKS